MPQKFDAASKHMIEAYPGDWIALGGLPAGLRTEIVDSDLSAVSLAGDKMIRVIGPLPYVAHLEFQSGPDGQLDERVMVYNVVGRRRHGMPVKSVVFLLRPQAMTAGVSGRAVSDSLDPTHQLEFTYRLVRIWELKPDLILKAGLGTLPLAPISNVPEAELPRVVEVMKRRLDNEVPSEEAREIWTATRILMGLRYARQSVELLLSGVKTMEDSTTYQEIIEKGVERGMKRGMERGRTAEVRTIILRRGGKKLGLPDSDVRSRLESIDDIQRLEDLVDRLLDAPVKSWSELFDG